MKIYIFFLLLLLISCSEQEVTKEQLSVEQKQDSSTEISIDVKKEAAVEVKLPIKKDTDNVSKSYNINASSGNIYRKDLYHLKPGDIVLGNRDSKIMVIEYFSPTCFHCATFYKKAFHKLKAKYIDSNKIAYIRREFIASKQDLYAASLARCKGDADSYQKFLDVILSTQENWITKKNYPEILTNIGSLGGISPEEYQKCVSDDQLTSVLKNNTFEIARMHGFTGTPCFIINEEKSLDGIRTFEDLAKEIDKEISRHEKDNAGTASK